MYPLIHLNSLKIQFNLNYFLLFLSLNFFFVTERTQWLFSKQLFFYFFKFEFFYNWHFWIIQLKPVFDKIKQWHLINFIIIWSTDTFIVKALSTIEISSEKASCITYKWKRQICASHRSRQDVVWILSITLKDIKDSLILRFTY